MTEAKSQSITKDDLHRERSRFLDAFAALEEALALCPTSCVDDHLTKEIKALRLVRNDVVHAQLKFVQVDGKLFAVAMNSQEAGKRAPLARLLHFNDLKSLRDDLIRLRKSVEAA